MLYVRNCHWGLLVLAALAVLAAGLSYACSQEGAGDEDRHRLEVLQDDELLSLDLPGLTSTEPVTTILAGGSGPTLRRNKAERRYVSSSSPADTIEAIQDAAQDAGWTIGIVSEVSDGWAFRARREEQGVESLATVIVYSDDNSETVASVSLSADKAP